jgi:hypothetical protein
MRDYLYHTQAGSSGVMVLELALPDHSVLLASEQVLVLAVSWNCLIRMFFARSPESRHPLAPTLHP